MKLNKTSANLLLVLITVAWGLGFILVKYAINNNMSASIINMIRGFIFMFLTLVIFFPKIVKMNKYDFKIGLIAGAFNFLGFITQTIGAKYTTPSNNAFLTVTNVLIVPFIVWVCYGKKPSMKIFVSVLICLYGMAWLTGFIRISYRVNLGDILSIVCAVCFAFSISILGNSAKKSEFSVIAFMMGFTHFFGSVLYFVLVDKAVVPSDINWGAALVPVIFIAIFGSFLAQTGQVVAQRHTSASSAALIMTLEGLFGAIFSVIFGYDLMSWSLVIGGLLIMLSLFISEFDFKPLYYRIRGNNLTYDKEDIIINSNGGENE